MPVIVRQHPKQEQASSSLNTDGKVAIDEVQTWHIIVDEGNEWQNWTPALALLVPGLPTVGSLHPLLPTLLRCKGQSCKRSEDAPRLFIATITYGTMPELNKDGQASDKWNIKVKAGGVERTEDLHVDLVSKKPIVSSSNESLDPPVRLIEYEEDISVEFRTKNIDFDLYTSLRGKISTDEVTMTIRGQSRVFPPKTLKLDKLDYSTEVGDGIQYWQVSLVLRYRSQKDQAGNEVGHIRQVVDKGFYEFNESWSHGDPQSKMFQPIKDSEGNFRTTPAFLDGNGRELVPDTNGDLPQCVLLPYHVDRVAALNPLLTGIS